MRTRRHKYTATFTGHNSEGVEVIVHEMETGTVSEIIEYVYREYRDVSKVRRGLIVAKSKRTGQTIRITYEKVS